MLEVGEVRVEYGVKPYGVFGNPDPYTIHAEESEAREKAERGSFVFACARKTVEIDGETFTTKWKALPGEQERIRALRD